MSKMATDTHALHLKMQTLHKQLQLKEAMVQWGNFSSLAEQKAFITSMGSETLAASARGPLVAELHLAIVQALKCISLWVTDPQVILEKEAGQDEAHIFALLSGAEKLHKVLAGQGEAIQRQSLLGLMKPHLQMRAELLKERNSNLEDIPSALARCLHLQAVFVRCEEVVANVADTEHKQLSTWALPPDSEEFLATAEVVRDAATRHLNTIGNKLLSSLEKTSKECVQALNQVIGSHADRPVWSRRLAPDCSTEALAEEATKTLCKAGYTTKVKDGIAKIQEARSAQRRVRPPAPANVLKTLEHWQGQ